MTQEEKFYMEWFEKHYPKRYLSVAIDQLSMDEHYKLLKDYRLYVLKQQKLKSGK